MLNHAVFRGGRGDVEVKARAAPELDRLSLPLAQCRLYFLDKLWAQKV